MKDRFSPLTKHISPCTGGGCVKVEVKLKDDDGKVKIVKMDGLAGNCNDYSLENLDKQGIFPKEVNFSSPSSLDVADSAIAAAEVLNDKFTNNKIEK